MARWRSRELGTSIRKCRTSLDSHTGDSPKSPPPGRVALVGC